MHADLGTGQVAPSAFGFIAVHVGAGYHARKHETSYLEGKRSVRVNACSTSPAASLAFIAAEFLFAALSKACLAASIAYDCVTGVTQAVKALEVNLAVPAHSDIIAYHPANLCYSSKNQPDHAGG